ncbi:MAG: hypothetical protein AAFR61_21835 [Bacteroidota bacterium]
MNEHLPLELFLTQLEQEGFAVDLATRMRLMKVLERLSPEVLAAPEKLSYLIVPLLARDQQSQARIHQIWRSHWAEMLAEVKQQPESQIFPDSTEANAQIKQQVAQRRKWMYPVVLGTFLGAMLLFFQPFSSPQSPPFLTVDQEDNSISTETIPRISLEEEIPETGPSEQVGSEASSPEVATLPVFNFSSDYLYVGRPVHLYVGPHADQTYYLPLAENEPALVFPAGTQQQVKINFQEAGVYHILDENKQRVRQITVYPAELLSLSGLDNSWAKTEAQQSWIKLFLVVATVLLVLLVEVYLRTYEQKLHTVRLEQYFAAHPDAPYELPFPQTEKILKAEDGLYQVADKLRARTESTAKVLDITRTLHQTIQGGGFPSLAYKALTRPTEYIALIDRSGLADRTAELFESLLVLLKGEDIPIHLFYFRNDPRSCEDEMGVRYELEDLAYRYGQHRLIVFSQATFFLDLPTGKLHRWVKSTFEQWPEKVLLTPVEQAQWGQREKQLATVFPILGADLESQEGIAEALLADDFEGMAESIELVRVEAKNPLQDVDFEQPEDLQDYLGDALYQWVVAGLVSSKPSWRMYLALGRKLEAHGHITIDAGQLLSYNHLLKLARIPWLNQEQLSQEAKAKLLDTLDPEMAQAARELLLEEIQKIPASREGLVERTVLAAGLAPQDKELQQKLRFLWKKGWLGEQPQKTSSRHISGWLDRLAQPLIWKGLAAGTLAFLLGIGVFSNFSAPSQKKLNEQYFQSFPFPVIAEGVGNQIALGAFRAGKYQESILAWNNGTEVSDFEQFYLAQAYFRVGDYQKGSAHLSSIHSPGLKPVAKWYSAQGALAMGNLSAAKRILQEIAQQSSHPYQGQARNLLQELTEL